MNKTTEGRSRAVGKIPEHLHGAADELALAGVPWDAILTLLGQITPILIDSLKSRPAMQQPQGRPACPEDLKVHLKAARDAACETLCQCCNACCAACCDD